MPLLPVPPKLSRSRSTARPLNPAIQWMPVLFGLAVICVESTRFMGGAQTGKVLADLWQAVFGQWDLSHVGDVNHYLRKAGHITGYGLLALVFLRAWSRTARSYWALTRGRTVLTSSGLSVACTFLVACLDEWHQSFLPGRTSTVRDVLLDTAGAVLFNAICWGVRTHRLKSSLPVRTAGHYGHRQLVDGHPGLQVDPHTDRTDRLPRAA
jgi:VanZ family protein